MTAETYFWQRRWLARCVVGKVSSRSCSRFKCCVRQASSMVSVAPEECWSVKSANKNLPENYKFISKEKMRKICTTFNLSSQKTATTQRAKKHTHRIWSCIVNFNLPTENKNWRYLQFPYLTELDDDDDDDGDERKRAEQKKVSEKLYSLYLISLQFICLFAYCSVV